MGWESWIPKRKLNNQPPHNVPSLKVFFGTVGMSIMTGHTSLADSPIRIHGMKVGLIADRDCTSDRSFRSCSQGF